MTATAILLAFYFLPTIIAASRDHMSAGPIFALNLTLGWSALGWIIAFVWSLTSNTRSNRIRNQPDKPAAAQRARPARPDEIAKIAEAKWIEEAVLPWYREKYSSHADARAAAKQRLTPP